MTVTLVVAAAWIAAASPAPAQNAVAIKGGKVVTMAGDPIDGGVVLIRDGKIQAVGKDVPIPTEARVIDAAGKVVMPGFVDVHAPRGVEQASERNSNTPFLSVIDALDPALEYFEECRRNGVTTIAAVPGDETMIGSQAAVIKTAGTYIDQMVLKRRFAVKISLKPTSDRNRMSQLAAIRKELDAAKTFMEEDAERKNKKPDDKKGETKAAEKKDAPKAEEKKDAPKSEATPTPPPASPTTTPLIEALVKVLKRELTVYLYCENAMDVPQGLRLVAQYNLKPIFVLGQNAHKAATMLARPGYPVVLDPQLVFWETDPRTGEDKQIVLPKIYREAGVKFGFQTTGFQGGNLFRQASLPPTVGTNYLWFQAATAVKYGMPEAEALQAMTVTPAKWLGVDAFVGTLEPGKDADVAILTGEPLKLATWVDTTLVNGQVVYERSKDKKLEQLLQPKKG